MKRRNCTQDRDGRRRPTRQSFHFGAIECLESRTLLSVSPHARIVNGQIVGLINGTPTSSFEAVGEVGDRFGPYCTGTLISSQFVLTAGHCAQGVRDTQGRFTIAGNVYSTSHVYVHPGYSSSRIGFTDGANDIALFELSVSVAGIRPDLIFRDLPHVGDLLTLVGFGAGGTGRTGQDNSFGIKRAGTTPIDSLTQRRVLWNFDNNRESNTAPGDSGGPAYVNVGGVYYIAGITSGGSRADAAIGDHSFDTRVDYYASWIDSIVGTTVDPNPDPDPTPGPDDEVDVPDSSATPLDIAADGSIHATGSLEAAGDRDVFQIALPTVGNLALDLSAIAGSFDAYVRIYDASGDLIASDDDSGPGTDSHISLILQAGTYYVSAGAFNDAGGGDYSLGGTFSLDDHADSFTGATPIALASGVGSASGTIGLAGDHDVFRFVAGRDGRESIDLRATDPDLDPVLEVYDARGRLIALNDDSGGTTDSHVTVKLHAGSIYYVLAEGFEATHGAYSLQLAPTVAARHGGLRSAVSAVLMGSRQSNLDRSAPVDDPTINSNEFSSHLTQTHANTGQPAAVYSSAQSATYGTTSDDADPLDSVIADALCPSLEHLG